ncbi:MAG: hypothetical protein K2X01_11055 [Cyanobacteria bacterium]|nr:hypothetical protein [Cyanobacteriota bacterium]
MSALSFTTGRPSIGQFQHSGAVRPATNTTSLVSLCSQLGQGLSARPDGTLLPNEPLIRSIIQYRDAAVPVLSNILNQAGYGIPYPSVPAIVETLYTAQRLAQAGVNTESLYPAASRLNTHPDPLVQIYLAGFYRQLKEPAAFGPMLSTLINQAVTQYPHPLSSWNVSEEVGGTVLQQIANRTAEETVRRLQPYLQRN